ncbi:MAG: hydrogenase maturation protease [Planctomycetota bacterium]
MVESEDAPSVAQPSAEKLLVGLGSPHGDDQIGWSLVKALQFHREAGVAAVMISQPSELLDHLHGCEALVVVDACSSGHSPGTIERLEWPDERIACCDAHSTHGFSIAAALSVADRLQRLPRRVVLYVVEAGACNVGQGLGTALVSVLPELERRVLQEFREDDD